MKVKKQVSKMRGGGMMKDPMAMKRGGKVMKGKKKKVMKKKGKKK
ncbi:MAG TPA: hypothetical protein VLB82_05975 [Thermodesulfobacteriota bacterium]|jgi:hypothetical protein|nr:hypothetical protein [Thermodesulfobacteriota bacterium]